MIIPVIAREYGTGRPTAIMIKIPSNQHQVVYSLSVSYWIFTSPSLYLRKPKRLQANPASKAIGVTAKKCCTTTTTSTSQSDNCDVSMSATAGLRACSTAKLMMRTRAPRNNVFFSNVAHSPPYPSFKAISSTFSVRAILAPLLLMRPLTLAKLSGKPLASSSLIHNLA